MDDSKYLAELGSLSGYVHGRNGQLVRLALLGLRAGRDAGTLAREIIEAGGEPLLTDEEVGRAILKAEQIFDGKVAKPRQGGCRGASRVALHVEAGPNSREIGFVREMIQFGEGATSKSLMEMSPVKWEKERSGVAFLQALFRPDELVFTGTPLMPRTRENLKRADELIAGFLAGQATIPTHVIPNPFTGKPGRNSKGKESYCLDSTVAHRRLALIEFDELPLKEQAAFWAGAIKKRLLPVRSLVYSGAKSIHGLIELKDDGTEKGWDEQWKELSRLVCSDTDRAYHADSACKNEARMTRFPGATRPETRKSQSLLYLERVS